MERRPRIVYTDSQKALMWERWRKGDTLHQIEPALHEDDLIQSWALKWIDPDEKAAVGSDPDRLGAYIHSITMPESDSRATSFSVDFGSAPIASVLELLTTLKRAGATSVDVHSRTVFGMNIEPATTSVTGELVHKLISGPLTKVATSPDGWSVLWRDP